MNRGKGVKALGAKVITLKARVFFWKNKEGHEDVLKVIRNLLSGKVDKSLKDKNNSKGGG